MNRRHLTSRARSRGFTLIEILMVMFIVLILAMAVAPRLQGFIAGRESSNTATRVLALADYARTQSASEARTYRMNFDTSNAAGAIWLTVDTGGGQFQAPTSDYGARFNLSSTLRMDVNVTPQANMNLMLLPNVQQQEVQQTGQSINGTQTGGTTTLMQNLHPDGTYIEFDPSGRVDQANIKFTDRAGKSVTVACTSATDVFHILAAGATR
jgi:prepilin-type N-terminal cleavage/methylation domain-containing protein